MSEENRPNVGGDNISAQIGDNAQQVAVGKNINQQQQIGSSVEVTQADLEKVSELFADLKQKIAAEAPPEKKEAAIERVNEMEEEIVSQNPDVSTMEYVRGWFGKNLPGLLGAVTSVVVNPIVGKVVEAAGGLAAEEIRRRFGSEA